VHKSLYIHLGLKPLTSDDMDYLGYVLCMCNSVQCFLEKKRDYHMFWRRMVLEGHSYVSDAPLCNCIYPNVAVLRIVSTDTNGNLGRQYFCCPVGVDDSDRTPCDFFQWKGTKHKEEDTEAPYCECNHAARPACVRVSQSEGNPGRKYYSCSHKLRDSRCRFFQWV
jgi:hypothetical protein